VIGKKKDSSANKFMDEAESLLEKNRISGIEAVDDDAGVKKLKARPIIPILILASIAAVLLAGTLIVTKFFYNKPGVFTRSSGDQISPLTDIKHGTDNLASDNTHIIRGKESYARGYLPDAITEFSAVVESDANDRDKAIALTYMGMISDDKGDYDKAIEYYNRAQTYDKKNPDIYKNLSLAYRHKKDFDKAIDSARQSSSLNSDDTGAKKLLGDLYFERGNYDDAISRYREILDKSPEHPGVLYNMGSALMAKGDEFSAMEYFKKAGAADRIGEVAHRAYSRLGVIYMERKNFEEALKYLKDAVAIRPNDALNRYNLGIAYLRRNMTEEAMGELAKAEQLGAGNVSILEKIGEEYLNLKKYDKGLEVYNKITKNNEQNVKILSQIAKIHYEKGELDKAYETYRRITLIEPATENARVAYLNMGNIMDDAQRYDQAIESYEKALSISPKDHTVYLNIGIAYKHAGKPELAIKAWKQSADLNANDPQPLVAIADLYYERGYYDLAETEYQRVISRWPNAQEPHFKMATIYYKRGKYEYAMNAYKKVIDIDDKSDLARKAIINRAVLMSKTGKGEESLNASIDLIRKALIMKPDDPQALMALGIIYMKKERYDNAMDTFYQVIKGAGDSKLIADAYNNIGKCYFKKRQYKKALQAFTRGVDEDPGNEEIRMNRRVATQEYEKELGRD
jgi:tetratricopeptide (TPR) repeat protein